MEKIKKQVREINLLRLSLTVTMFLFVLSVTAISIGFYFGNDSLFWRGMICLAGSIFCIMVISPKAMIVELEKKRKKERSLTNGLAITG